MAQRLTAADFHPHVAKVFRDRGGRHALTLHEVSEPALRESPHQTASNRPFTLIFRGPVGDVLPEGLRAFEVEGGGEFELYVMPIHTVARDRQDYQAVFN